LALANCKLADGQMQQAHGPESVGLEMYEESRGSGSQREATAQRECRPAATPKVLWSSLHNKPTLADAPQASNRGRTLPLRFFRLRCWSLPDNQIGRNMPGLHGRGCGTWNPHNR
jgi:hypothetical protein